MPPRTRRKVGETAAERTAEIMGQGLALAELSPGQLELPEVAPAVAATGEPAVAVVPGLDVASVREALRRSPHRPEDGNARLTTDLPAELRAQLTAYRTYHQLPERALLTHLVRQLLAADADGGWREQG